MGRRRPGDPPILVDADPVYAELLDRLSEAAVVAADTESNSMHAYTEQVCLVQLTVDGQDYLVDPFEVDLRRLDAVFERPRHEVIFHAAEYDVMCLRRDYGFDFTNLFDTMISARILGWPKFGLGAILEERFGVKLDKKMQRHNWGARPLTPAARDYARLDTHYLHELREIQMEELEEHGRTDEARAAFARVARAMATPREFDPEGYWAIKGARKLSADSAAALRELYAWREELAQRIDRPLFKVVGDKSLVEIAARQPRSLDDLRKIRGLSPHLLRRNGQTILRVLQEAQGKPPPKPPPRPRRGKKTPADRRFERLRSWRKRVADARGVEYDVILPKKTMLELAALEDPDSARLQASAILDEWQLAAYGEDILRTLQDRG